MIFPPFRTALVPAVGAAVLTEPGLLAAGDAAIVLSAVTVRTEKKHHAAFAAEANPLPQNCFAMRRHAFPQAGLDKGNGFVAL